MQLAQVRTVTSPTNAEWKPPNTMSLFQPFAEAIRDAHKVAYNLPATPPATPTKQINPSTNQPYTDEQLSTSNPYLAAYYDRKGGYSGD
jgi:hypothetical protein